MVAELVLFFLLSSREPPIHRSGIYIVLRQSGSLHRELRYNGDSLQRLYSDTTERSNRRISEQWFSFTVLIQMMMIMINSLPLVPTVWHMLLTGNPARVQSFLDAIFRVQREFTACGGIEVQGTYAEFLPSPPIVPPP